MTVAIAEQVFEKEAGETVQVVEVSLATDDDDEEKRANCDGIYFCKLSLEQFCCTYSEKASLWK